MIKAVKFVGLPVKDQDRALAFWRDKVGFKVATDQPFGKQRWIELKIPGAETGLALFTPEGHEDRVGTFFNGSLLCGDVQKTHDEMAARRDFRYSPGTGVQVLSGLKSSMVLNTSSVFSPKSFW